MDVYLPVPWHLLQERCRASLRDAVLKTFTLRKLECSRQAIALNTLAWNNTIGPRLYFVGF
jgi:hypothetical protein